MCNRVNNSDYQCTLIGNVYNETQLNSIFLGLVCFFLNLLFLDFTRIFPTSGYVFSSYLLQVGVLLSVVLVVFNLSFLGRLKRTRWFHLFVNAYLLPFNFAHILLLNQNVLLWQIAFLMSIVVLACMLGYRLTSPVAVGSIFGAYVWFVLVTGGGSISSQIVLVAVCSLILLLWINSHQLNVGDVFEERVDMMRTLSGAISHELRTPIMSVATGVRSMRTHYKEIVHGYQLALEAGLPVCSINPQHLRALPEIAIRTDKECIEVQHVMEMLMIKGLGWSGLEEQHICNIREIIEATMDSYPYEDEVSELLSVEVSTDFLVNTNRKLMTHVLKNLIKNALHSVRKSGHGRVSIRAFEGKVYNTIIVRDTGGGIDSQEIPYLFDAFYTNKEGGSGVGLAFSKLVVEASGGTISCYSIRGEYAEFTIKFPKLHEHVDNELL